MAIGNGKMTKMEKFPYPCIICKERFKYPSEVGKHVEAAHLDNENSFICEICGKTLASNNSLIKHKRIHNNEKSNDQFQCSVCQVYFEKREDLDDHFQSTCKDKVNGSNKEEVRKKAHSCKYCGRSFAYAAYKVEHEKKHIGSNGAIGKDGITVDEVSSTKKKRKTEDVVTKCDLCDLEFCNKYKMHIHRRTHPNANTAFPCAICGKVLKSKTSRYLHTIVHQGKQKHKCLYCDRKFTGRQNLILHTRTHTKEKPLECKFCGKRFSHPTPFRSHERSHTGEKPYKCNYCEMSFGRYGSMQNHVRLHTGEKPYTCNHCGKTFAQQSTWSSHEKTHTNTARRRKKLDANTEKNAGECEELVETVVINGNVANYGEVEAQWNVTKELPQQHIVYTHQINNSWVI